LVVKEQWMMFASDAHAAWSDSTAEQGSLKDINKDQDVELIGMINCGDCPGATIVTRLAQVKLWNKAVDETITKIHIGPCIVDHCPHKDIIIGKIRAKSGVEVIEGCHPYKPSDIFAS
jgi:predicted metal-binding protein